MIKATDKASDKTAGDKGTGPAAKEQDKSTVKSNIDSDLVRQLAGILDETGLTEIEYDTGGLRIRVARNISTVVSAPAHGYAPTAAPGAAPVAAVTDPASHPGAVRSPMVGVAYLLPEPGAAAFAKLGDTVVEGQTIALIEAMKTFNPVKATRAGKVTQILIENGSPVEYGEPLMIIE